MKQGGDKKQSTLIVLQSAAIYKYVTQMDVFSKRLY